MISMTGTTEMLRAPVRGPTESQLERLKLRLLRPVLATVSNTALVRELYRAANEAAALAWLTVCPALVLPLLLEEKVRETFKKWENQQRLLRRSEAKATMREFV